MKAEVVDLSGTVVELDCRALNLVAVYLDAHGTHFRRCPTRTGSMPLFNAFY